MLSFFYNTISKTKEGVHFSEGFVLLFSVLVSSILLAVGLGIFSIAYKELLLSSSDRESQIAFYAADSGAECAIYWDAVHPGCSDGVVGFVDAGGVAVDADSSGAPTCAGVDINDSWTVTGSGVPPIVATFDITLSDGSCAKVTVTKDYSTTYGRPITQINSRGFNTCSSGAARRAERGLRLTY
jgi:hypothetical protein